MLCGPQDLSAARVAHETPRQTRWLHGYSYSCKDGCLTNRESSAVNMVAVQKVLLVATSTERLGDSDVRTGVW